MVTPIQLAADAPWKARFRAAKTYGVQIAGDRPERGLAVNDATGVDQLYAWDVPTGALRQFDLEGRGCWSTGDGIVNGILPPNGLHVYYLDDRRGDETGHVVRVPFEGGPAEDITPDLPDYNGLAIAFSADGSCLGFTAILAGQYRQYTQGLFATAFPLPPQVAARTEELVWGRLRHIRESDALAAKRIFVSHSHEDDAFGLRLVADLQRALGGDDTEWYDSSGGLHGGDAWWAEIRKQLEARPIFLVILSPASMRSKWVGDEVDMAWRLLHSKQRTRIIPVLYQPCTQRLDLQIIHQVSFLEPKPYEEAFLELLDAVNLTD